MFFPPKSLAHSGFHDGSCITEKKRIRNFPIMNCHKQNRKEYSNSRKKVPLIEKSGKNKSFFVPRRETLLYNNNKFAVVPIKGGKRDG